MSELPEYQIFSVLRPKDEKPIGPYSQNELLILMNQERVKPTDLVHYPDLDDWKPISEVFDLHQNITNFEDHGQDPNMVSEAVNFLEERGQEGEKVYYVAVQHFPVSGLTAAVTLTAPKSIALTDRRLCVFNHKLMGGLDVDDYPLNTLRATNIHLKQGNSTGAFCIFLNDGEKIEIPKIPTQQLKRLEHLAEERLEERRLKEPPVKEEEQEEVEA